MPGHSTTAPNPNLLSSYHLFLQHLATFLCHLILPTSSPPSVKILQPRTPITSRGTYSRYPWRSRGGGRDAAPTCGRRTQTCGTARWQRPVPAPDGPAAARPCPRDRRTERRRTSADGRRAGHGAWARRQRPLALITAGHVGSPLGWARPGHQQPSGRAGAGSQFAGPVAQNQPRKTGKEMKRG